jgi:hypothetical protein
MKKVFFVFALGAASLSLFAFSPATKKQGTYKARENFQLEFGSVPNVSWQEGKQSMQMANFTIDNQVVTVFFDKEGELVATTVSMTKSQLPLKLRAALDQQLADIAIDEIFSLESPQENCYYISADGGKKVYQGYANGQLREVSKLFRR